MPYVTGNKDDIEARVLNDREQTYNVFERWRDRQLAWQRMVYPTPENALARLNPGTKFSEVEQARQRDSSFVTNHVGLMVTSFVNRMERSEPQFDVALLMAEAGEDVKQETTEYFVQGLFNQLQEQYAKTGEVLSFMKELSTSIAETGKACSRVQMVKDGATYKPVWDIYNPLLCYHDLSDYPRRFYADTWDEWARIGYRLEEMGRPVPNLGHKHEDLVRFTECWIEDRDPKTGAVRVWDGAMVDNAMAGHLYERDEFSSMPIQVLSMGRRRSVVAMALNRGQGGQNGSGGKDVGMFDNLAKHAEPFFAPLEHTIPQLNRALSIEMEAAFMAVNPPKWIKQLEDGKVEVDFGRWGPGTTVILPPGLVMETYKSQLDSLQGFMSPQELKNEIERVWPSILWGATATTNESGYLFNQRIDAGLNAIVAPILNIAQSLHMGMESLLEQSRARKAKVRLKVKGRSGATQGRWMLKDFDAEKDIPESYQLKATIAPMLPEDELRQVQIHQLNIQSGIPMEVSLATTMKVQNPSQMVKKWREEKQADRPEEMDRQYLAYLDDEIEKLKTEANMARSPAERSRRMLKVRVATRQRGLMEQKLMGSAQGFQMQGQPGTPPPSVQPPEERGIQNPDDAAGAMGGVSSYLGGRGPAPALPALAGAGG